MYLIEIKCFGYNFYFIIKQRFNYISKPYFEAKWIGSNNFKMNLIPLRQTDIHGSHQLNWITWISEFNYVNVFIKKVHAEIYFHLLKIWLILVSINYVFNCYFLWLSVPFMDLAKMIFILLIIDFCSHLCLLQLNENKYINNLQFYQYISLLL